jgi:hypothetical protein
VVDDKTVEGHWELKSFGMVSPFMYVDTPTAANVGREMNGWSVAEARIESPETDWLVKAHGTAAPDLMSLETDVVPALNADQEAVSRLLMTITTELPPGDNDDEAWKTISSQWGERQVREARTKALEGLPMGDPFTKHGQLDQSWPPRRRLQWLKSTAMEVLFRGLPVNLISMKQFRDAQEPDDACYQALNVYPESITRVHDVRPIQKPLYVGIRRYPTAPIVDTLGLDVKWTDNAHGQPVQYLQAIRPFWIRADVKAELGRDVAYRAGSLNWTAESGVNHLYFDLEDEPATPVYAATLADKEPEAVQDFGSERIFRESLKKAKSVYGDQDEWAVTRGGHFDQLREPRISFAPQTAIESILNHRWVNFDPKLRGTTLDPDAAWVTLIPKASIPNESARQWFLESHERLVQCFERVYDRFAAPARKQRGKRKEALDPDAPLPPIPELLDFLQRFELAGDVEEVRQRDTRKTAQKIYEERLREIKEAGGGTSHLVKEIQSELQEHLGTIEADALDDFFRKLEACIAGQSLTKQKLMAEVALLWMSIGSTDSLRVLIEVNEEFWGVDPRDLGRIQYLVPPDKQGEEIRAQLNRATTELEQALDAHQG